jgi:hypothetical protein
MPPYACRCSFETSDHDEFVDHVLEAFNGSDDIGTDGRAHAELAGEMRTCACGYVALSPLDLDVTYSACSPHLAASARMASSTRHHYQGARDERSANTQE